jgi:hypothetical protein
VAGLTAWEAPAPVKQQVRAAGPLHGVAGGGTAAVLLAPDEPLNPTAVVQLLHYAWQKTEVARLRLVRQVTPQRQLTAPWEEPVFENGGPG